MPVFEYKCPKCGKQFEEFVKKYDDPALCPVCGERGERVWAGTMHSATGKPVPHCSGDCKTCGGCR